MSQILKIMENEIKNYTTGTVEISPGYRFSQYALMKRLMLYMNQVYPQGKIDSQGRYKYFFDIISPRIDSEIKNIDFDTKDIILWSDSTKDAIPLLISNLAIKEWLRDSGQAEELNEAIEEGSSWGDVVWKRTKDGHERVDLKNFFVINQTAKTLEDSPVIERHILTQSDLRAKSGVWENVEEVIKTCGKRGFASMQEGQTESKETPYYEIYERNGEISERNLFEAQGKSKGKENKYILGKIIVAGLSEGKTKHILFAEEIKEMPYKEYHRGRYKGRWMREGITEILFDIQTRANKIGNQIDRGLDWASKTVFSSKDKLIAQNVLTDIENGDIIRTEDIRQVEVRMQGLDQLIADWNRLMQLADKLCNSYEVVSGESLPAQTPFRLGFMLNQNANKLFDFLREKFSVSFESVIQDWVLPELLKDLKAKDVIRLTGNSDMLQRYYEMVVDNWYFKNLLVLPPHSPEQAKMLKDAKMAEIQKRPQQLIKLEKGLFDGFKPRVRVVISGENVNLAQELETLSTFINLEQDPVRRTALIEIAMMKRGIDVGTLPKTPTEQLTSPKPIPMGVGELTKSV